MDYNSSAVGHKYAMWQSTLFRGICQSCEINVYQYILMNALS